MTAFYIKKIRYPPQILNIMNNVKNIFKIFFIKILNIILIIPNINTKEKERIQENIPLTNINSNSDNIAIIAKI